MFCVSLAGLSGATQGSCHEHDHGGAVGEVGDFALGQGHGGGRGAVACSNVRCVEVQRVVSWREFEEELAPGEFVGVAVDVSLGGRHKEQEGQGEEGGVEHDACGPLRGCCGGDGDRAIRQQCVLVVEPCCGVGASEEVECSGPKCGADEVAVEPEQEGGDSARDSEP